MSLGRERPSRVTHPPWPLLTAASLCGCVVSYRDLGESVLTAGVSLALIGGALVAALQWIWSPLLPARPSLRRALVAALVIGVVATLLGSVLSAAPARPEGSAPATLTARAWFDRLHLGTQLFGAAILAWTLVLWRILLRARPQRAASALPAMLAVSMVLSLLAVVYGGRRALPDLLFVVIYWSGTLGIVPAALWCALALEGALRRRARPRAGSDRSPNSV